MKAVPDTMLWVSYCTRQDGYRHRLIERARRAGVRFFVSSYILDELGDVLADDLGRSRRFVYLARRALLRIANVVTLPLQVRPRVPGDRDDDPIVQTALSARADYLVTADKELLRVRRVERVQIVDPAEFERALPPGATKS